MLAGGLVGLAAALPAIIPNGTAGQEPRYDAVLILLFALWSLRLRSGDWSRPEAALLLGAAGVQIVLAPPWMYQAAALGTGAFVYLVVWCLQAYDRNRGLQALATAALLLSAGVLAKPALAMSCALLSLTFYGAHFRNNSQPLGFGLLLFTPALLSSMAVAAFMFVSAGTLEAGPLLPSSTEGSALPHLAWQLLLFPAATLAYRLLKGQAGAPELAFAVLCLGGAASRFLHWPASAITGADLFFIALGGSAALLAGRERQPRLTMLFAGGCTRRIPRTDP